MASQHAWRSVKKNEVYIQICEYIWREIIEIERKREINIG